MTASPSLLNWAALRSSLGPAAAAFLLSRGVVLGAVLLAPLALPQQLYADLAPLPYRTPAHQLVDSLVRWDAWRYLSVASIGYRDGYLGANPQAFPLYPGLMRLLGGWLGDSGLVYTGYALSHLAFFAALVLLHHLVQTGMGEVTARRSVLYLAVFPTSFFFSSLYAESLFLLLCLGFFLALRQERWALAGVLGGAAALTRAPGVLLALVMAWELAQRPGGMRRARPGQLMALACIPAGSLLFMALLWLQVGDPLAFLHVQSQWGREASLPIGHLTVALEALTRDGLRPPGFGLLFPAALIGLFVLVGLKGLSGQPAAYRLWFWVYLGVSLSAPAAAPFYSVVRFLLVAFPAFIGFAQWGERPWFHRGYLALSLFFLALSTLLFAQWYWVA